MSERLENALPPEWSNYLHLFQRKELSAKSIILSEGDIARKVYFIEKGCIRLAYNDHGKDISFHFFFEGDVFTSHESFWLNQPCLFSMETIEPAIIHVLSKNNLDKILKESIVVKTQLELHKIEMLVFYQEQLLNRIKNNPQERYNELINNNPILLQRIPHHYIASYLGITPVSLSRIRKRY